MVRGRHYYSYIADCSQSKQSQDEVSDPPTAFRQAQKKKSPETAGKDIVLNSGLLCKLPSDLVDFFLFFFSPLSLFPLHSLTDKCALCAYADPVGSFYSFIGINDRSSHPGQHTPFSL